MDLTLRTVVVDSVPVVEVHGEVDLATIPRLRDGLHRELDDHPDRPLILDLDGVTVFDDIGLGVLLGARRVARSRGTELVIVATTPRLRGLLAETGLDAVLPPAPSVSEAVRNVIGR
jgi:anti-sigma B factor antagonist